MAKQFDHELSLAKSQLHNSVTSQLLNVEQLLSNQFSSGFHDPCGWCWWSLAFVLDQVQTHHAAVEIKKQKQASFENQLQLIKPGPAGRFTGDRLLASIVANNMRIMIICTVLSLFYGTGAIFILNYNASIAGVMYGSILRSAFWGAEPLYYNLPAYLPHTLLEISAYLLAAISGGILSKASAGEQEGSVRLWLRDGVNLFILSCALIFIAGIVEVHVIR